MSLFIVSMLIHLNTSGRSSSTLRRVTIFKTTLSFDKRSKISRKNQLAVVVTHPDFKSGDDVIELHAVKKWFVVDEEVNKDYFFDAHVVAE